MLVEVRIPVRAHGGSAYEKVKRRTGDWATAAAGAALWLDGGDIAAAGIALSAVNPDAASARRAPRRRSSAPPPSEEAFAGGRRARRPRTASRSATSAAPPTTSATWRAS